MSIEHAPCRMLRTKEVLKLTGWSRATIWRKVKSGDFPAPVTLGPNSIAWPEHKITSWQASRPTVNYAPANDGAEARGAAVG